MDVGCNRACIRCCCRDFVRIRAIWLTASIWWCTFSEMLRAASRRLLPLDGLAKTFGAVSVCRNAGHHVELTLILTDKATFLKSNAPRLPSICPLWFWMFNAKSLRHAYACIISQNIIHKIDIEILYSRWNVDCCFWRGYIPWVMEPMPLSWGGLFVVQEISLAMYRK